MIVAAPTEASSNELADWLELEALCSESGSVALTAVNTGLEIGEDDEPAQLDDENVKAESRLAQVSEAFDERRRAMGDSYPFEVDDDGTRLSLRADPGDGGHAYLFCLIVSAAAPNGLLSTVAAKADLPRARELFQVCATLAAAGFCGGPAFSVGWPRPDRSAFLDKLREVYRHFGDGSVHTTMPLGAPAHVKDDGVDVIAWQHTSDTGPRLRYFLGQAASGDNWEKKSLKGHVETFHGTWFSSPPPAPMVGTIMPFCLASPSDLAAPDDDQTGHEDQLTIATLRARNRRYAFAHGELLYRHRVALFVAHGLTLHAKGVGPIERVDDLPQVVAYVQSFRKTLRHECAA